MNTLYYGDNLYILREHIPSESVDLVYLDPPFNSNRSYNVLFKDESGQNADAQITAFDDTWHWGPAAEQTFHELASQATIRVSKMIDSLRQFIGENQMMAYLVMMAARLVELHRVLKSTGSIYLHCDPTASHYLKIILDVIFGAENFRSEIIWKRQSAHSDAVGYGSVHDTILYYSKTSNFIWNDIYQPYEQEYIDTYYRYADSDGRRWMSDNLSAAGLSGGGYEYEWKGVKRLWRCPIDTMKRLDDEGRIFYTKNGVPRRKRYLDESKGIPVQDLWTDLESLRSWMKERLGFPTQKPFGLLERIILASSNPGDIVLDPFSGCGTSIAVAQKLNRKWIGIDITHLAINMHKYRLKDMFNLEPGKDYQVIGEPQDLAAAQQLAREDRYQFQWWALSLINARPLGGEAGSRTGKKGSDKGIDGQIPFIDDQKSRIKYVVVQVKSGHVNSAHIRDLRGTLEREENSPIAVFLTLEEPTSEMIKEAVSAGFYTSALWQRDYPRIQILTVQELLNGATVNMPPTQGGFKKAPKVDQSDASQPDLGF